MHNRTLLTFKYGGAIPADNNAPTKSPRETFLYLDVSVPFNTNELKWSDLSTTINNIIPPHRYAAAIISGANNNTLFLYGGDNFSGQAMDLVYTFDAQNNLWSIPKITGVPPIGKVSVIPITDYNGLIYLFCGATSEYNGEYMADMFILDTINLSWKKASTINAPGPMVQYGAVFLPNKNIIYMGGFNKHIGKFTLNEVYLYDTTNDIWTTKIANGLIPSARSAFSSVLGLDGQRVIIFGGQSLDIGPETSLYVLDLNSFTWYIPKITGNIPSAREFHKATLIGKYMVITFGDGYTQGIERDVLLLDISNNNEYAWTTSFVPLPPVPSQQPTPLSPNSLTTIITSSTQPVGTNANTSSPLPQSDNTDVIVVPVIGSLIGGILLTIGSSFLYRRYKNVKKQNNEVPTIYNHGQETIPISRNTGSLAQNVDQSALQNLIAQAIREEVNNLRSQLNVDNRTTRNFNQGSE